MKTQTIITTTSVRTRTISGRELRELLNIPDSARLFIKVPGGGDWSNEELSLDDVPLTAVSIVTETREHEN